MKNLGRLFLIILFLYLLLGFTGYACAIDFKKKVLPNGLILINSENHNLPVVMVSLILKAGMINEPPEKAGLANLVSETLAEGTISRTSRQISEELDFIGASFDTETTEDYISIDLSVLKKDVERGFGILSDVLINPVFPEEEIKRKKEQIKGYLKKLEEEPSMIALKACKKEVFGEHPYGRMVIGEMETVNSIERDDILRFYRDFFKPNSAILTIVGDISEKEIDEIVGRYFGKWDIDRKSLYDTLNVGKIIQSKDTANPEKKGKVIRLHKDITQANIIMGGIGISRDNPDYYALSVMNYIFGGGGFSSRLMKKIRDDMGLAYDIHSLFTPNKQLGMIRIGLQTRNEAVKTAIGEIYRQMEKMRNEYVTDTELSEAKSFLIGNFKRRLDTNRKIADFLSMVEFFNLGDDYLEKYPEYINSVTKDDILRVARKYLIPENFVTVIVANQKYLNID